MEQLIREAIAVITFSKLGFHSPSESHLPELLRSIKPSGGTSLRDALLISTNIIFELNKVAATLNTQKWNFVHIVLTDGEDSGSKVSFEELAQFYLDMGLILDIRTIKTEFIGVNLDPNSRGGRELKAIS